MEAEYEMAMTRARTMSGGAILIAAVLLACTAKDEPPRVPLGRVADSSVARQQAHALLGPAAKAALDSGNVLFRKKAYDEALAEYRAAAALAPQHSAPLFGMYMVARATNNKAMAASALDGIRRRNGPMPAGPHALPDTALRRMHEALRKKAASS
jgi:tetratricopeptide (TPR) repeat protein